MALIESNKLLNKSISCGDANQSKKASIRKFLY